MLLWREVGGCLYPQRTIILEENFFMIVYPPPGLAWTASKQTRTIHIRRVHTYYYCYHFNISVHTPVGRLVKLCEGGVMHFLGILNWKKEYFFIRSPHTLRTGSPHLLLPHLLIIFSSLRCSSRSVGVSSPIASFPSLSFSLLSPFSLISLIEFFTPCPFQFLIGQSWLCYYLFPQESHVLIYLPRLCFLQCVLIGIWIMN